MITSSQSATPLTTMTLTGNSNTIGVTTTSGVSGVVLTKPVNQAVGAQQTIVGNSPQIVPANVQILNVNAVRAAAPNQPGAKTLPQRVMIGTPQMVGARPGQPGQITLQTLQGLAPGTQGHLLLKTENGQYQLLRVGPATAGGAQQAQGAPISANNVNAFRVQTISGANTPGAAVQTQVPALAAQSSGTGTPNNVAQRGAVDQTKEKCRKFLANLLELSSREPKAVEKSVRTLIQELVDMKVEPEQFCDRLERLLNASPQPCLIGFLKKSLPLLRQSMVNNELIIDGIRPPPASVLAQSAPTTNAQIRGQIQMTTTPQMRVITQPALRPGQQVQHRIISPMRTSVVNTAGIKTGVATIRTPTGALRPQIVRTPITLRPGQTIATKTPFGTRPILATTQFSPSLVIKSGQPQQPVKEKRTFSSSGFVGDDDINDVAAMGGVNLAEESQRILGSTEFVGTQIRSCKDELYLHTLPLMNRIARIARKHGLEEPSLEVASLISHATQERLKTLVEKLAVIAEHRIDLNKADPRYEVSHDVRAQLKCLEEVDRAERKRHEEHERELLLRAAKSRTKPEDPEQMKLKAKAKEMQRAEMEELRQREANLTALLAIGTRKKPKLEDGSTNSGSGLGSSSTNAGVVLRPRTKRVCLRDLLILMEQEKETCRGLLLYKSYFK
ncbi:transcription initiation factor TFIID subunit 4 isoform X1 [Halyomorpha halys]|uniref:transcription initiation factor TFIID subunit 4 isoform X1 n=1 Tax=Halyomorpha halys TaxID=286706 RepID=UPI0006D4E5AD|nr:transcription initiation factor TFIID subunit 4 isoform X1 [Halyomorpha halys]